MPSPIISRKSYGNVRSSLMSEIDSHQIQFGSDVNDSNDDTTKVISSPLHSPYLNKCSRSPSVRRLNNKDDSIYTSPCASPLMSPLTPHRIEKSTPIRSPRLTRAKSELSPVVPKNTKHRPVRKIKSERSLLSLSRKRSLPIGRKNRDSISEPENSIMYHDENGPIKILEQIGMGSYSVVYKGERINQIDDFTLNRNTSLVALKIFTPSNNQDNDERNIDSEVDILTRLNGNKHIVEYLGRVKNGAHSIDFFDDTNWSGICLRYYRNGDIYNYMNSDRELSQKQGHVWIIHALKGLSVLHNSNPVIMHRDIKSPNFLIDDNKDLRLTDFGLARCDSDVNRSGTFREFRTSMYYCPPELFETDDFIYQTSADIYSITIVIWEILSYVLTKKYKAPFQVSSPWQIPDIIMDGKRPLIDEDTFGQEWIELLEKGWNQNAGDRINLDGMIGICKSLSIHDHDE